MLHYLSALPNDSDSSEGANVELCRELSEENMFLFGTLSENVEDVRHSHRYGDFKINADLKAVFDAVRRGTFGDADQFGGLVDGIEQHGDYYLVSDDFQSYIQTQDLIDAAFKDTDQWLDKSILSVARSGFFSSDRAVQTYAEEIWNIEPLPIKSINGA